MKGEYKEFTAGEELKEFDLVTVKDGKVYKWRKKKWYKGTISLPRKPVKWVLWVVVIGLLIAYMIIYGL